MIIHLWIWFGELLTSEQEMVTWASTQCSELENSARERETVDIGQVCKYNVPYVSRIPSSSHEVLCLTVMVM